MGSADEIYEFFGLSRSEYTITAANVAGGETWSAVKITANFAGVDPLRELILAKAGSKGAAYEVTVGRDAYDKVTIKVGEQATDITLIGKKMNINGRRQAGGRQLRYRHRTKRRWPRNAGRHSAGY